MGFDLHNLLIPVTVELRHVCVKDIEIDLPTPGEPMHPNEPNATVTLLTYHAKTGAEVTIKLRTQPAATEFYLNMIGKV